MSDQFFETRNKCPVCKDIKSEVIYKCDFLDEPVRTFINLKFKPDTHKIFQRETYILKKCMSCSLIYQVRVFNERGMYFLYNKWLAEGDKEVFNHFRNDINNFIYYSQELIYIAALFNKNIKDIKILDYGMGQGKWCTIARDMGYNVTGTDVSENLLQNGKLLGLKVLPLTAIKDKTYDFINTEQVFEHLRKPLEVLESLKKSLAINGIIKISVPNGNNIEKKIPHMDWKVKRGHKNFLVPVTPAIHINTFSQKSIKIMGVNAGLKPIENCSILSEYKLINATSLKELFKSIVRPIYRRAKKHTCVYFR